MTQVALQNVEATVATFTQDLRLLRDEIGTMIVGQEEIVEGVMMCLLGGGHALLEGVPGLGKTMSVRTIAETIHARSRASSHAGPQPADIVGTNVIVEKGGQKEFESRRARSSRTSCWPTRFNRATPRRSPRARGDERRLGHGAKHNLPARRETVFVLATQNPLEMEGPIHCPRRISIGSSSSWSSSTRTRKRCTRSSTARPPTRSRSRRR